MEVREIGSRLELFVDEWLIEQKEAVQLTLHHPVPAEIVMEFNMPWEGNTCGYVTVFKDKDIFRMYYRASNTNLETGQETHPAFVCYAESTDGIHWTRSYLNLYQFNGSKNNNIILQGLGSHTFATFLDTNPAVKEEERYKAFGAYGEEGKNGLFGFVSKDGIYWKLMKEEPVFPDGVFDSQNTGFYDNLRNRYFAYHRGWTEGEYQGIRSIMVRTSEDFQHWTKPEYLVYEDSPEEHLYTNAITPYFRAPHIFFGFPKRFVQERQKVAHRYSGVSDGVFMTSRDGKVWKRWNEALIRPGLMQERWINRNNMTAWGIIATKSNIVPGVEEISLYSSEAYYVEGNRLRRFTIRMDGFVSVHTGGRQGMFTTHPLVFDGRNLVLNYSTSAAG
ncbi:MAG TPA: hypothetical protein PL060_05885, partial [bacterium]|nr:hypothetical protein [bacterium]